MSLSPGEPHAHQRYIFEWLPAIIEAGRRGPLKLIDTFMREKLLFRKFIRFKSRAGKESRENASCTGDTRTGVKFEIYEFRLLLWPKQRDTLCRRFVRFAHFPKSIFNSCNLHKTVPAGVESSYRAFINFKFDIETTSDFRTIVFA